LSATENHSNGHHPAAGPAVMIVDLSKRFGGADVRVLQLAAALRASGVPFVVATLSGSPLHRRLAAAGHPRLAIARRRGDPRIVLDLARVLRANGFGVIDAQNPQSQLWSLLAGLAARVPVRVTTVHSQYMAEHGGSARGRFYEGVLRLNRRLGGRFVVVSEPTRAYVESIGVPAGRTALIANAVPPAEPDPAGRQAVLGEWPPDSLVVGVVARLEPVKGVADLIEALALVAPDLPRVRLLVVGDGRSREALEQQVAELGLAERVRFTGFRDDVGTLLSGLDVFCLPSHSEGLPFALLEACAHRLPLLVTGVGGMDELLEDGVTARVVRPADPADLARGLRALADAPDESAAMAQRAHDLVAERFSVDAMITATLGVYR
jgi:glycosyltransferase involved in cell wall biosynthesis